MDTLHDLSETEWNCCDCGEVSHHGEDEVEGKYEGKMEPVDDVKGYPYPQPVRLCMLMLDSVFKMAFGMFVLGSGAGYVAAHDWPQQTGVKGMTAEDAIARMTYAPEMIDHSTFVLKCPRKITVPPSASSGEPGVAAIRFPYRLAAAPGNVARLSSMTREVFSRLVSRVPSPFGYNPEGATMSDCFTPANAPGSIGSFYTACMTGQAQVYPASFPSPFMTGAVHREHLQALFDCDTATPVYRPFIQNVDGDEALNKNVTPHLASTTKGAKLLAEDQENPAFNDCVTAEDVLRRSCSDQGTSKYAKWLRDQKLQEHDFVEFGREQIDVPTYETMSTGSCVFVLNNLKTEITIQRGEPLALVHVQEESYPEVELKHQVEGFNAPVALIAYDDNLPQHALRAYQDYRNASGNPELINKMDPARLKAAQTLGTETAAKSLKPMQVIPLPGAIVEEFRRRGVPTASERARREALASSEYADNSDYDYKVISLGVDLRQPPTLEACVQHYITRGFNNEEAEHKGRQRYYEHDAQYSFWSQHSINEEGRVRYYNQEQAPNPKASEAEISTQQQE